MGDNLNITHCSDKQNKLFGGGGNVNSSLCVTEKCIIIISSSSSSPIDHFLSISLIHTSTFFHA